MKKIKILKVFAIMPLVLMIMFGGCGASKSVDDEVSEVEGSGNENQDNDLLSADSSAISSDETPEGQIERVDNPDGGWTISEYDETGEEVKQSIYDAEGNLKQVKEYRGAGSERKLLEETYYDAAGKLMRNVVYNDDGSIKATKEYEYNDAGEKDKVIDCRYNTNGTILSAVEYDGDGKQNKAVTYTYYANGSLKSTSESDGYGQTKIVSYRYNANGDLKSTSERITGRKKVDRGNVGSESSEEVVRQKETEHFVFYSTSQDIAVLDVIAETLEGYYAKVTSDLGIEPHDKTKVYVSPSLEEYHKAIGRPDAPDWSVGSARQGDLYMVSPLNPGPAHNYDDMFDIAVHEFTHVVVWQYGWNPPSYLNEGIATYEAGQNNMTEFYVRRDIANGTQPSMKEMAGWNSYADMEDADRAYAYGYVYIDFALEVDGYDTVISLLEGKTQTEAFGMSMEELNEKWMDFLTSYEK